MWAGTSPWNSSTAGHTHCFLACTSTMGRSVGFGFTALIGLKRPSENKRRINTGWQNTKEGTMSQTVVERTAEQIAESVHQASRATSAVADAIEDGVGVVRRAAKQG